MIYYNYLLVKLFLRRPVWFLTVDEIQLLERGKVCTHRGDRNDQRTPGVDAENGGCLHGCHQEKCLCRTSRLCAGSIKRSSEEGHQE